MLKESLMTAVLLFFGISLSAGQSSISDSLVTVVVDGVARESHIYVPPSYQESSALPLVMSFHGSGGTPEAQRVISGLEAIAARESFIVVSPKAKYIRKDGRVSWNVNNDDLGVDDMKFVRSLILEVSRQFSIDSTRIYSTGFSGGGRMSSRIGCDLADLVAAIAPVAGVQFPEDCKPTSPMPIMTFHGEKDAVNHYVRNENSPHYWHMGVDEAMRGWAGHNGCDTIKEEAELSPEVTFVEYVNCSPGVQVVLFRMANAGHSWPGSPVADGFESYGSAIVREISASEMMWSFFQGHQRK